MTEYKLCRFPFQPNITAGVLTDEQNIKQTEGAFHIKSVIFRSKTLHILKATWLPIPTEQHDALLQLKYGKQGVDEAVSVLAQVPRMLERLTIWFVL